MANPTHGITGQAGLIGFGAANGTGLGRMNGKLTGWRMRMTNRRVDDTGAGEYFESNLPVRSTWEVEINGNIPLAGYANYGRAVLGPSEAGVGAVGVVALKQLASDTNIYFYSAGACEELEVNAPIDGVASFRCRMVCSEGTQPTMNTNPA